MVVGLAYQLDVELGGRPVELLQRRDKLARDLRLLVERDEHGIDRQPLRRLRRWLRTATMVERAGPEQDRRHVDERQREMNDRDQRQIGKRREDKRAECRARDEPLLAREHDAGAEPPLVLEQRSDALFHPPLGADAPDGIAHCGGRGDDDPLRKPRPRLDRPRQRQQSTGLGNDGDHRLVCIVQPHGSRVRQLRVERLVVMDQGRIELREEWNAKRAGKGGIIALGVHPSVGQQFALDRRSVMAGHGRRARDGRLADTEPQQRFDLDLPDIIDHARRHGRRDQRFRSLLKRRVTGADPARRIFPDTHDSDTPSLKWQCSPRGRS